MAKCKPDVPELSKLDTRTPDTLHLSKLHTRTPDAPHLSKPDTKPPDVLVVLNDSFWDFVVDIFTDHTVHFLRQDYKYFSYIPPDAEIGDTSQVEIFVGAPFVLSKLFQEGRLPELKWAQTSTAGNEILHRIIDKQCPPSFRLSRFVATFPDPMAEYVLGMIIATRRGFYGFHDDQVKKIFEPSDSNQTKPLQGSRLAVLGLGRIGRKVAQLCKAVNLYVVGVTRTPVAPEGRVLDVDEYRLSTELKDVLSTCHYIVNILPSTEETVGVLGGDTFAVCRENPVFINIGRGDVISETDILKALRKGWLSAAVLDVFQKEPLPPESPLWTHPKVIITPHISGRTAQHTVVQQFAELTRENYRRYLKHEPLLDEVDLRKGY